MRLRTGLGFLLIRLGKDCGCREKLKTSEELSDVRAMVGERRMAESKGNTL